MIPFKQFRLMKILPLSYATDLRFINRGVKFLIFVVLMSGTSLRAEPITHLLVLGNSIAWHTPSAALGWGGNWGMAASKQETDFAHVITSMLEKAQEGQRPVLYVKNVSDFEQNTSFDFDRLKFVEEFQPDAVIVFLGDNVKSNQSNANIFKGQYEKLLRTLVGNSKKNLYCVSTWWTNKKVDEEIFLACGAQGGRFVDIKNISKLPGMKAGQMYSNSGVAAHPSDAGMEAIAKNIVSAMKEQR